MKREHLAKILLLLIVLILIGSSGYAYFQHNAGLALILSVATFISLVLIYLLMPQAKVDQISSKDSPQLTQAQYEQNLKDAQHQLMIQEKLASVGLLAAGIAHEIKNPLNFINNFSDMTVEMLDELKQELENPLNSCDNETKEAINSIVEDVVVNCKKINEHGKRAESIIKNMLIQARTSAVEKAPLDLNALLEEYLNLSYHGMRAQNNKLNVKIDKLLDNTLPQVTVDQQSIGRVFLNIINNALYASNQKSEKENNNFMPTITIASEQDPEYVKIKIKDNGNGIPEEIRKKIFEPFFTTKPAGQGTGLGLPICYDIVVKEHGGILEVNSQPGEFTEFIITLPKDKST
ncbi:MAG: GHKL domain-containing protein [Proteobacteria bacterium]|nr:GHKL domain-containing protein [Pseudomonadota bacterium]